MCRKVEFFTVFLLVKERYFRKHYPQKNIKKKSYNAICLVIICAHYTDATIGIDRSTV
jgi:hypothetical protein